MRQKLDKKAGAKKPAGKEIVRRELKSVLTNGTVSDASFLAGDEAVHCVAIKERSTSPNEPSSFGITILDAATGSFSLSAFDDDICRTKLECVAFSSIPVEC